MSVVVVLGILRCILVVFRWWRFFLDPNHLGGIFGLLFSMYFDFSLHIQYSLVVVTVCLVRSSTLPWFFLDPNFSLWCFFGRCGQPSSACLRVWVCLCSCWLKYTWKTPLWLTVWANLYMNKDNLIMDRDKGCLVDIWLYR